MSISVSNKIAAAAAAGLFSAACGGSSAPADSPEGSAEAPTEEAAPAGGEMAEEPMADEASCKGEGGCEHTGECKGEGDCKGEGECKGEEGCEGHAPE